jgi:hypothetical protein
MLRASPLHTPQTTRQPPPPLPLLTFLLARLPSLPTRHRRNKNTRHLEWWHSAVLLNEATS